MAARLLTDTFVKNAKPVAGKRVVISDHGAANLSLLITPNGAKTWIWRGRVDGKEAKKTGLPYPTMGISDARAWAASLTQTRASGGRPLGVREVSRVTKAALAKDDAHKVDALFDAYMTATAGKDAANKRAAYNRRIKPRIGQRHISTITYEDLAGIIDATNEEGYFGAANRLHALIAHFMKWCVTNGRLKSGIKINPYSDASKPNAENRRDRVLTPQEVALLWRAVDTESAQWAAMYRLILLTAVRRSEASDAAKSEFVDDVWTIPGERTKNGRPHLVCLAPMAQAAVAAALAESRESKLLFPNGEGKPLNGFTRVHNRILAEMTRLNGGEAIERFNLHDLRRTARTEWSRLKIDHFVAVLLLNHTLGGLHATYDRYDRYDEKSDALIKWEQRVAEIIG